MRVAASVLCHTTKRIARVLRKLISHDQIVDSQHWPEAYQAAQELWRYRPYEKELTGDQLRDTYPELGSVIETAEVGGLHHRYERRAA